MSRIVKFPDEIRDADIEAILAHHYLKTRGTRGTVTFDLQSVTWCDPFSLSLLTLWILELASLKKAISVLAPHPRSSYLQYFLQVYSFVGALNKANVRNDFPAWSVPPVDALITAPILPLTFCDAPSLRALLNDLQSPDRLEVVLRDVVDADIVKSGAIRDVAIAELGSNFFNHAGGRFAHLLMTTSGIVHDDKLIERVGAQVRAVPPLERSFFQALRGQPYLVLVFSDMGPGIPESIRDAYGDDTVVGPKTGQPTHSDLLQYSFLYHSTGRPLEARIGQIRDVISGTEQIPPPTGLYQLRKMVRDYRGMLVVRTGRSRLAQDFLSDINAKAHLEEVSEFGGTQYKLCFPFNAPRSRTAHLASFFQSPKDSELSCVSLVPSLPPKRPVDNQAAAAALDILLRSVERVRLEATRSKKTLVIDARGVDVLPSNALFYLQLELMRRQEAPQFSLIVNGPTSLPEFPGGTAAIDPSAHPILVFDQEWVPRAVGLVPEEESFFRSLIADVKPTSARAHDFAAKHPEWFHHRHVGAGASDEFLFRFTQHSLKKALREEYRCRLSAVLTDTNEGFFSPDERVLLPSKSYCHGYFDTSKFVSSDRYKNLLYAWIAYAIDEFSPTYVVTIGATAADLVLRHDSEAIGAAKILHVPTPVAPSRLFFVSNAIPSNSSVIIVTDVVGTSNTLKNVLQQLRRAKILVTLAVVDATNQDEEALLFEGKTYAIQAIVKHKIAFYAELPAGWDYDDIAQVDPETHALIPNRRQSARSPESLWTGSSVVSQSDPRTAPAVRNAFLEEAAIPAAAILEGHYVTANAHMIHLFNIPALIKSFGARIVDLICSDVNTYLGKVLPDLSVSQIAYPEYSLGLSDLGNALCARFSGSSALPISRHILDRRLSSAIRFGPVVLLLDNAMYSGDTVFEMLDLVESSGEEPMHVLVYTILRRGSLKLTNRVRKIKRFGRARVTIREIADIELPVFKRADCPMCALVGSLDEVSTKIHEGSALKRLLTQDLTSLGEREPDFAFRDPGTPRSNDSPQFQLIAERVRLRWMLESSVELELLGVRNMLAEMVRAYEENPETSLRFFEVLARERVVFLQNAKLRKATFYPTFATDVIRAVIHFTERFDQLSESEAEGVIGVLAGFDPTEFLNRLPNLLAMASGSERRCWLLLRECILSPEIRGWPSLVIRALAEGRSVISPQCLELIDDAMKLWGDLSNKERVAPPPITEYRRLTAPAVHNLGKATKKLVVDIAQKSTDLSTDWPRLNEALTNFSADLSRFRRGLPKYGDTEELWTRTQALNVNLRGLREAIGETPFETGNLDVATKAVLAGTLERIVVLVDSMSEPYGIRRLLEEYRTNVLTGPLEQAIVSHREKLNRAGIDLEIDVPKRAPQAFGLAYHLFVVFGNVLENVINSGAQKLKICVTVHPDDQRVAVAFLDNGRGVDKNVPFHDGLLSVKDITTAYGGSFELRTPLPNDPQLYHDKNTLALVNLRFLPEYRR